MTNMRKHISIKKQSWDKDSGVVPHQSAPIAAGQDGGGGNSRELTCLLQLLLNGVREFSLCSLGSPRTRSVDQTGLEFTEIHLPLPLSLESWD